MVNTQEFASRLEKILDFYGLSAASFADRIDVGRSSISHILSGRNKPSLDFVMKVINQFPEVELYWLLNGKGSFPKRTAPVAPKTIPDHQQVPHQPSLWEEEKRNETEKDSARSIKKVVILYSDGTFEAFEN